ncbi:tRNA uridine-5-carboxymethylaminomethyl(34) synthesis GTPase MnmE [Niabella beijingensis]|uniref:tRNA uridine-5-carboxymethylaminomethyl(34) synthesis GTPase MnmE n=1 Tax=Niabella beijingensis TaxID=2872700 RepID=UPI001CBB06D5|nr:tRNA uridine-5-carboxymethylaminomethyl(34) synthesis GTPase MnmE [Niabella beijingensis]MBZ4188621.1 tRNA uridine-5-carboxymethylaminomethyl(34) synthesis GTPase MnmE [Niabella beijingensis]
MKVLSGFDDTIAAIATPPGIGAIGVIRLSGRAAIPVADAIFKGKKLEKQPSHTVHFGHIIAPEDGTLIDEVVVTLFRSPRSYTGEDVVEISGHGSPYILQKILEAAVSAGARLATAGEYTQRAFLNGKLDLAQAEAVADLIAADSRAQQQAALQQLRGGFSGDLAKLREQLINFAALIELELDFSDEDVEFADRAQFSALITDLKSQVSTLLDSFRLGNVIKNGVRVAIIGKPNSGKSTLLNALLNEERAIVSDIAGTTRDTIEETLNIKGVLFRLIDTAGIREHTTDQIESIGMERSKQNAEKATILLHLVDVTDPDTSEIGWLKPFAEKTILVKNKIDREDSHQLSAGSDRISNPQPPILISAKNNLGIEVLRNRMYEKAVGEVIQPENSIVTNARHYDALSKMMESLNSIEAGMDRQLTGDLLSIDIRRTLHYLGEITGQVEVDRDILGTIFGKFCIGK